MKSPRDTHVCVIGAGVCGINSVKACLEAGFQVTCYDKRSYYGGLWQYQEKTHEDKGLISSVMQTTILNTSKELSSFSDFPPPAQLPNYMKHDLYMEYIRSYVEHFQIESHLKLRHEVMTCRPQFNEDTNEIEWLVLVYNLEEGVHSVREERFDKLIVAIGHHNIPYEPTFPDQQNYTGLIIHSAEIKNILTDKRFLDKRVVVVGFGNSACDAANDLALVSKRCYLSSHRGNWFYSRLSPKGPYESELKNRWHYEKQKLLPRFIKDLNVINRVEGKTNHTLLGLTPKHKPSEQFPIINDIFPFRVFTGGITLKGSLLRFTEDGVIFEGEEDNVYKADVVILATGYKAEATFFEEFDLGLKSAENKEYELYLNIFAPKLIIPGFKQSQINAIQSLAFVGLVQPAGSITVISELQARLVALVFGGRIKLPRVEEMVDSIATARKRRSAAIRSHSRDQLIGDWISYADLIASKIGAKPNLLSLFFSDFALWKRLFFGPSVAYQYRLVGPGNWSSARQTIMTVDERIYQGINDGKNHILFQTRHKYLKKDLKEDNASSTKDQRQFLEDLRKRWLLKWNPKSS